MLGKRSRPAIENLGGALRSGIMEMATSPRSPLECKMYSTTSPKGLKNYDQGGVGLGIVVALDNSSNGSSGGEILAKYALCGPLSTCSSPIPVGLFASKHKHGIHGGDDDSIVEMMEGLEEDFTYVTCHGPNKSLTTRVYYEDGEYGNTVGHNRSGFSVEVNRNLSFKIPPAMLFEDWCGSDLDFLSYCLMCSKNLHGKDIYMYRGEKAFCSAECRERQIAIDERQEQQCRSEASKSDDVTTSTSTSTSISPYTYSTSRGPVFSPGIVAI